MMNPEIKAQWVAALRSGDYAQESDAAALRTANNTFCCLGVLCDLAVKAGVLPEPVLSKDTKRYTYGSKGDEAFLPDEVIDWVDASSKCPIVHSKDFPHGAAISSLNDSAVPFSELADLIEEQL